MREGESGGMGESNGNMVRGTGGGQDQEVDIGMMIKPIRCTDRERRRETRDGDNQGTRRDVASKLLAGHRTQDASNIKASSLVRFDLVSRGSAVGAGRAELVAMKMDDSGLLDGDDGGDEQGAWGLLASDSPLGAIEENAG